MTLTLKFHTALKIAALISSARGELTAGQLSAVWACADDPNCDVCRNAREVAAAAATDSGAISSEQAANAKAINWATLIQLLLQILPLILPYLSPAPPPAPKA